MLSLLSNPVFRLQGPATDILLGGHASSAGVGESTAVLFWHDVAAHARATVKASIAHLKFANKMYLQALGFALAPILGWPSKHAKVANAGTEKHADLKGKGKVHTDAMDEDEVIILDTDSEEWDGIT